MRSRRQSPRSLHARKWLERTIRIGSNNRSAVGHSRRIQSPKRTKERLRRLGRTVVTIIQQANKGGYTERSGHQRHLVVCVGRQLSHFVQDRNRLLKLGLGESDLSHK